MADVPVPTAKLYLVESSLRGRKARRRTTASPAAQARAELMRQREERALAEKNLLLQAQAVAQMRRA